VKNFQTYFGEDIVPANVAADAGSYVRVLTSTLSKIISVPSGARYVVFSGHSSLMGGGAYAAEYGTSSITSTTTAFPAADAGSTAGIGYEINPKRKYLPPGVTTIGLSTPLAACVVGAQFYK